MPAFITFKDYIKGKTPYQLAIMSSVVGALLWSTGGLGIKWADMDAASILLYRSLFAGLLFILLFRKKALIFNRYAFIGSLLYVGLVYSFVNATKLTTAANAIFLQYTAPILILLLEPMFLKTQFERRDAITVLLCICGMSFFLFEDFEVPGQFTGILFAACSGVILSFFLLTQRMRAAVHTETTIFLGNMWVVLLMAPQVDLSSLPPVKDLTIVAWLGIFQLGLGYAFFNFGQKHLRAIESSIIAFIEPIFNPVWVMIGYGEIPGLWACIGGIIIPATLLLRIFDNFRRRRKLTKLNQLRQVGANGT